MHGLYRLTYLCVAAAVASGCIGAVALPTDDPALGSDAGSMSTGTDADTPPPPPGSDAGTTTTGSDAYVPPPPPPPGTDAGTSGPAPCVEGDFNGVDPDTGHCLMYFTGPASWSDAVNACAALGPGAYIATSADPLENGVIAHLAALDDVWIGASDSATEDVWLWETGEPMPYTNWRTGEPNDSNGEDCMILEGDNAGLWDDRNCGNLYAYLCERE